MAALSRGAGAPLPVQTTSRRNAARLLNLERSGGWHETLPTAGAFPD